ncbi:sulfate/molybdate ABC transporter ATP-binding protein [Desulfuribacillus alkaliarsenatis]|uniref:ABC transporter domain-containing protein n=1 Tax=Desulfuribacillus alkaliarsenatis TaxID=766136 RepID=A0A1E5FZD0_9FIRM|nr:sulfate/molybdate ABC transporter ATP-binding protein [Desulfuribacillus alkaliarsenatis]OEF95899.1 hypothetical protein BHF68_10935 [Desulfuribacillus alkaliarsenatis]
MSIIVDIEKTIQSFHLKAKFQVENQPLGILGASGSGKSMILRCIAGLITPDRGRIIIDGKTMFDSEKKINVPSRERSIGYLFQNYALFPHLTVAQNVAFGIKKMPKKEQDHIVEERLSIVRMEQYKNRYPHQLSGGQQQRVALARALAIEPVALLLDEPFSALDNHLRKQMEQEMLENVFSFRGSTLFVSHNLEETYRICEQIMIIHDGDIVANGNRNDIFLSPPTLEVANITGCSNISRVDVVDRNMGKIKALDWGCEVFIDKDRFETPMYIGIRSQHLKLIKEKQGDNTFLCSVAAVEERVHQMLLSLKIDSEEDGRQRKLLQFEMSKEDWRSQWEAYAGDIYLQFDPHSLFLMDR